MIRLSDILTDNAPSIDLHGMARDEATIALKAFIDENIHLRNEKILIIHGKGTGILRDAIHKELKRNSRITEYKLSPFNSGSTVAYLKIDKSKK